MNQPSLTGLIIALAIVSMFMGSMAVFATAGAVEYGQIPEQDLNSYNKMNELTSSVSTIQGNVTNIKQNPAQLDMWGLFTNGFNILVNVPTQAMAITTDLGAEWTQSLNLGSVGDLIFSGIIVIFLVLIILGVLLAVLLRWGVI